MAVFSQRPNGKWQAKIRRLGFPDLSKTFLTKEDAARWARGTEREMDMGAFVNRGEAEKVTFEAAASRYEREVLPSKRGAVQDTYRLHSLVEAFGDYSLASISSSMLSKFRDDRLKVVKNQTVIHELNMISRVFKAAALDWGIQLPHGIPTLLVRKPSAPEGRNRRLEPGEESILLASLLECSSPWPHACVVLALETAGRQSEILSLLWKEVDLVKRTARLRGIGGGKTKNGDTFRDVPLSSAAVNLLSTLPRSLKLKGRVIPLSSNALQLSWGRAVGRARQNHIHGLLRLGLAAAGLDDDAVAGQIRALIYKKKVPLELTIKLLEQLEADDKTLVDLHFHDLRHEATSRLADKLQLHELMKVTGHKTSGMLARYYHPRASDLALKLA